MKLSTRLLTLSLLSFCCVTLLQAQTPEDSIKIVRANWHPTRLANGIISMDAEFDTLYQVPQQVSILEIDQSSHRFDVLVHTPREHTSVEAKHAGAVAAINGGFFEKDGSSSSYLRKNGVVIDTTVTTKLSTMVNGAIYITNNDLHIIPWTRQSADTCKLVDGSVLVTGPILLQNGKDYSFDTVYNQKFVNDRHPRSAIARMKNGKIYLVVVAGRFPEKAEGISLPQLRHFIRVLGGEEAINMDGGGSCTLWCAYAPDNGILNNPSDNKVYDNHGERKVGNSVCVYQK
jgi:exopolysaccharide biosynthesis protein